MTNQQSVPVFIALLPAYCFLLGYRIGESMADWLKGGK